MPSFLDRMLRGALQLRQSSGSLENPATPLSNPAPWLWSALGATPVSSGVHVTPMSSLGLTGFWACVKILSETIASLPLITYRRISDPTDDDADDDTDKERATDRVEYSILHDEFNSQMTSMIAREVGQTHLCTWGNSYYVMGFNGALKLNSLWPLLPQKTRAVRTAGVLEYETSDTPDGKRRIYAPEEILHVPGLSFDGLSGMSPIQVHRETIGHGIAVEKYGAAYFGRGQKPAGVYEHPAQLSDDAYARLKKSIKEQINLADSPHGTLILEEGMKYNVISIPNNDAQYIETRQFNISDMARIFRVPLSMLEQHEHSAAYAAVEQFFLQFAVHTIRPWLVRWEQEINRKVFGLNSELFCEHLLDAILRGDLKSRYDAYHVALTDGWITRDEVRSKETLKELPDGQGDVVLVPANMIPLDRLLKQPAAVAPAVGPDGKPIVLGPDGKPLGQSSTRHGSNGEAV